jgi:hypothetical protein
LQIEHELMREIRHLREEVRSLRHEIRGDKDDRPL